MRGNRFIKVWILIFYLLSFIKSVDATPEIDVISFNYEFVSVNLHYRYENQIQFLLFKSIGQELNSYLASIENKLIKNITFDIMIAEWTEEFKSIELYRYKHNRYNCFINSHYQEINFQYLAMIVNYCMSEEWKSFCYNEEKITQKKAIQVFNNRIRNTYESLDYKRISIIAWELDECAILFENDTLNVYLNDNKLFLANTVLPAKIQDRFIFINSNRFIVYENNQIVLNKAVTDEQLTYDGHSDYPEMQIFKKWININNGIGNSLSYSYEKNKLYLLNQQK